MRRPEKIVDSVPDPLPSPAVPSDRGAIRAIAKPILDQYARLAESTRAEYQRAIRRLAGEHWHDYATARQLRTLGVIRSAWRVSIAYWVLQSLRESEKADTPEARANAREMARYYAAQLLESHEYRRPLKKTGPRTKSKRASISGLPSDWCDQLVAEVPPKHRHHCVVMALTGARPEEMGSPVELKSMGDGTLEVLIRGAKVSQHTGGGQAWRRLSLCGGLAERLRQAVENRGGLVVLPPKQGFGLQKAIAAAATRLGFTGVSAYSFRHGFAADLKAAKADPDAISLALGHVSRSSKSRYGAARSGFKNHARLVAVEAASDLRGQVRDPAEVFACSARQYDVSNNLLS